MTIRRFWAGLATAAALGLTACATPGAQAPMATANGAPILDTRYGPVSGTLEGASNSVNVFRGVRYAASTEGRRFQRAADPQPWSQPLEATRFGSECPQIPSPDVPVFASWANTVGTSEDCLFLNVWTRGLGDGKKRPIMVWLHGGGYVTGSGSSNGYDGSRLAERGDVVAAIWIDEGQGTAHIFHTDAVTKEALVPAKLRDFVTSQVVPQGADALEEARADIAAQLEAAGVEAQVAVEPLGGTVEVRAADIAAVSQAAVEDKLRFPALVRIAMENQSAIYRQVIPIRNDPEAIWYPLEAHPDFTAIRALVEETPLPYFEPPAPGQTVSRQEMRKPSKAGSLQQTHFLIAYGLTLDSIRKLRAAGFDPVEALEAMNGRQTIEKRAMTATDIVVAEPAGIDIADEGPDGFSSSVRWRVVEVMKGGAQPGDELRQRLASGMRTDDAGETRYGQGMDDPVLLPGLPNSLAPGSRWVLHLSDALYRHSAYVQGGEGAARGVLKHLTQKDRATLYILADERRERQVWFPTFGRPLPPSGNLSIALRLARKVGARILPFYLLRTQGPHFDLHWHPPLDPGALSDEAIVAALDAYLGRACIAHADQWLALHDMDLTAEGHRPPCDFAPDRG